MPSHPLHKKLSEPTKNRLKRQSPNHLIKQNQKSTAGILPNIQDAAEPLQDFEEWNENELDIKSEIPTIKEKSSHSETELRTLAQEYLNTKYPIDSWTRAYTDGSAEDAIKNGGGGVYIRYQNGKTDSLSIATGKNSTNFRAEACALLHAAKTLNSSSDLSNKTVLLTDCKSVLQNVITGERNQILRELNEELQKLKEKTELVLQWLPAHCGINGNEKADALSKEGSKMEQFEHKMSYQEAKTIIKSKMKENWRKRHKIEGNDEISSLSRNDQVIIFRLRTGHCRLLSHMYKLKISHTDECPCGTDQQTPEHILQSCPTYHELRQKIWPSEEDLKEKLYGSAASLRRTAEFIDHTDLTI